MHIKNIFSCILLCSLILCFQNTALAKRQKVKKSKKIKKSKSPKKKQKKQKKQKAIPKDIANPALFQAQQILQAIQTQKEEDEIQEIEEKASSVENILIQQAQQMIQQFAQQKEHEKKEQEKVEIIKESHKKKKENQAYQQAQSLLQNLLGQISSMSEEELLTAQKGGLPIITFTCISDDGTHIWGIGEDHLLYHVVDDSWKRIYSKGVTKFLNLAYARDGKLYGLNTRGKVFFSSDNGFNWEPYLPEQQTQKFDQLAIRHGHRLLAREHGEPKVYTPRNNTWELVKKYNTAFSLY